MMALSRYIPRPWFNNSTSGNIGLVFVFSILCIAYIVPALVTLTPFKLSNNLLQTPAIFVAGQGFSLGTDDLGRDLFSRLIMGAQSSLNIGFFVVFLSASAGTLLGMVAAVYGGWINSFIMCCTDILMSLPGILLAIVIVSVLGGGLLNAMLAITLVSIPRYIRVVRSVAAQEMKKQYVLAALSFGTPRHKILFKEVLPNCWAPIFVQSTLGFSDAILDIAALGFLGLGAKAPVAEWGAMLADARVFIESQPYMVVLPGVCILITVLGFNLVGDALRDVMDPKTRKIS